MKILKLKKTALGTAMSVMLFVLGGSLRCFAGDGAAFLQDSKSYTPQEAMNVETSGGFHKFSNSLGVEVGLNLSSFSEGLAPGFSSFVTSTPKGQNEVMFGLTKDWALGDDFSLQTELVYNSYGSSDVTSVNPGSGGSGIGTSTVVHTLNYIEAPILLKCGTNWGRWVPYLIAGPSFGYLLSASDTVSTSGGVVSVSNGITKNAISSFNLAVIVGVGVQHRLIGKLNGFLQARYAIGAINLANGNAPAGSSLQVNGMQFITGINF